METVAIQPDPLPILNRATGVPVEERAVPVIEEEWYHAGKEVMMPPVVHDLLIAQEARHKSLFTARECLDVYLVEIIFARIGRLGERKVEHSLLLFDHQMQNLYRQYDTISIN